MKAPSPTSSPIRTSPATPVVTSAMFQLPHGGGLPAHVPEQEVAGPNAAERRHHRREDRDTDELAVAGGAEDPGHDDEVRGLEDHADAAPSAHPRPYLRRGGSYAARWTVAVGEMSADIAVRDVNRNPYLGWRRGASGTGSRDPARATSSGCNTSPRSWPAMSAIERSLTCHIRLSPGSHLVPERAEVGS